MLTQNSQILITQGILNSLLNLLMFHFNKVGFNITMKA